MSIPNSDFHHGLLGEIRGGPGGEPHFGCVGYAGRVDEPDIFRRSQRLLIANEIAFTPAPHHLHEGVDVDRLSTSSAQGFDSAGDVSTRIAASPTCQPHGAWRRSEDAALVRARRARRLV